MRVVIFGCGYVGVPLGHELVQADHQVVGVRRSLPSDPESVASGITFVAGDVTRPETFRTLPGPFDWVVNCVSSSRGGVDEYRQVYLEGNRHLVDWMSTQPIKKAVYTSSTSVYGQIDGSKVSESSPTEPASATSQVLVEAERVWLDAAQQKKVPAVVLRIAGIYGPDRGHLLQQYLRNEAKISGQGERLINMIHRHDVVGCIRAALKNGRPGEVYNAVDDEPVTQLYFFRWLSETLGKWMPPFATEETDAQRKRGLTQKRVSNRKIKAELGYTFKYPNFRQGYTAEIQRLDAAGLLPTDPEPR
jgi:nucleoside-diphosphate-sugar epimerase